MEPPLLKKLLKTGRVPSALLFYGREGSGKTYAAFKTAQALLCEESSPRGCGECRSCRAVEELREALERGETERFKVYEEKEGKKSFSYLMGEHPDLAVVVPSGNYVKIDQIRAIKDFIAVKPASGKKKVVIIDDAHAMTRQASNALLKTLEEPPLHTHFILTAPSKSSLLPTVVSRTLPLEFRGFTEEEVMKLAGVSEEVAKLSGGSLKRAKLLKEKKELLQKLKEFLRGDLPSLYALAESFDRWEAEEKKLFLELLERRLTAEPPKDYLEAQRLEGLLGRINLFKEGLSRGVNAPLWLFRIGTLLGGRE